MLCAAERKPADAAPAVVHELDTVLPGQQQSFSLFIFAGAAYTQVSLHSIWGRLCLLDELHSLSACLPGWLGAVRLLRLLLVRAFSRRMWPHRCWVGFQANSVDDIQVPVLAA
jgi:hypothetical protein